MSRLPSFFNLARSQLSKLLRLFKTHTVETTSSLEPPQSPTSLDWVEVRPGRFERAIDDLDAFFRFIASVGTPYGLQNWGVSSGIKYATDRADIISDLKQAWILTRYNHPNLASYVDNGRWVYDVIKTEKQLQQWLAQTFIVHSTNKSARELFGEFKPTEITILHVLPASQEVVVQCPHTHADGLGTVTLFNNMLKSLAAPVRSQPAFGDEAKNLLGPFTVTAKTPKVTAEQQSRWDAELGNWLQNMPTVGLAAGNTDQAPGPSKVRELTLSKSETKNLIAAAKAMGSTPTHVAHAAAALATRIHGNKLNIASQATLGIFAERDLCDLEASKIVTPHVTSVPLVIQLGDFESTVRSAKQAYTKTKADQYSISVSPLFADQIPKILSVPQPAPSSGVNLSSMGLLDSRFQTAYGDVKLLDYWFTINVVTPDVVLYVWTFQGRITFELAYNGVYYNDESVDKFMGLMKEQLIQGLKIEIA